MMFRSWPNMFLQLWILTTSVTCLYAGRSMDSTETEPELRDHYFFLGFRPGHELNAFGDKYLEMIIEI